MIRLAALLLVPLAGCATGSLDCTDLRQGACKVSFQRFLTDTSATFTGPDGLGFTYSSSPNAAATQEALAAINRLAGVVGGLATLRLPGAGAPQASVPSQPARPDDEDDGDISFRRGPLPIRPLPIADRSCPAGPAWGMARVTGARPRPPMLDGVAQALEL